MVHAIDVLFTGFSGATNDGGLGWSTVVLLDTDDGWALIDTGSARNRRQLLARLRVRGLTCSDISHVLLTHLHWDHICNVDLFGQAEVCIAKKEWGSAVGDTDPAYFPIAVDYLKSRTLRLLEGKGECVFDGVNAFLTPGHTPGSISFVANCRETVVLSGDAAKNRYELQTGEAKMSRDPSLSKESIQKILTLGDSILPGHDIWCDRHGKEIVPRGRNCVQLQFPNGLTMNGNKTLEVIID